MAVTRRQAALQQGGNKQHAPQTTPTGDPTMNWDRNGDPCRQGKGVKPLPEPPSVKQVLLMILLHICRRIVFVNVNIKVIIYLIVILFGSVLRDFFPFPKTYFAQKNSFMNVYFVKLGWGWTLLLLGSFMLLSSYTYCCGSKARVRPHMIRLLIASLFWYVWTSIFVYIESVTGFCMNKGVGGKITSKLLCIKSGHQWFGFDISGHAFILMYCSLLIMEETKCMKGWDRICDLIRNEQYDDESPMQCLTREEFNKLKMCYKLFTPYVRILFILNTLLHLLWDFMLLITILYFHSLPQKLVGGLFAVGTWFITYRVWYKNAYPGLPGEGPFRYMDVRSKCNMQKQSRDCM